MQLLGLKHRANTIVGDALLRGVSGGEKKRVSVGIEWAKSPGVWLFDEPTTGLDSSASYDVRPRVAFFLLFSSSFSLVGQELTTSIMGLLVRRR